MGHAGPPAPQASATPGERYLRWDELLHRRPPQNLSHDSWWLATKLLRRAARLVLLLLGSDGQPFWFWQTPQLLNAPEAVSMASTRDRYLLSSLMEEAITSSQMGWAATTRDVAKAMIRSHASGT